MYFSAAHTPVPPGSAKEWFPMNKSLLIAAAIAVGFAAPASAQQATEFQSTSIDNIELKGERVLKPNRFAAFEFDRAALESFKEFAWPKFWIFFCSAWSSIRQSNSFFIWSSQFVGIADFSFDQGDLAKYKSIIFLSMIMIKTS